MPKKYKNLRITEETMQELTKLRAWLELTTGKRYSLEATIKEMATEFNKAVSIPWAEVEKYENVRGVRRKK